MMKSSLSKTAINKTAPVAVEKTLSRASDKTTSAIPYETPVASSSQDSRLSPWSFQVILDNEKTNPKETSYLYDDIAKGISDLKLIRQSIDTWHVKEDADELMAQCIALERIEKTPWIMNNAKAIYYREDEPIIYNMLTD